MSFINKVISLFKEKKTAGILILIAVGIFLIVISSLPKEVQDTPKTQTLDEYKAQLEEELEGACAMVKGVGRCRVLVSFEGGAESTYKGSTLIKTDPPRVLGITVICDGARSGDVRAELTGMLTALFDIGSNRVAILSLNG